MADSTSRKDQPLGKTTMARLLLWSVCLSSGLIVLLMLGAIVVTLMGKPSSSASPVLRSIDSFDFVPSTTISSLQEEKKVDHGAEDILKQIYNRRGYSNPTPTPEDEADAQKEVITNRPRRKRPLKLIGKDFDPNKSFVIKHPNGTLTYVFPNDPSISTTSTTTTTKRTVPVEEDDLPNRIADSTAADPTIDVPTSHYSEDDINEIMNAYKTKFAGAFGEDVVIPDGDVLNSRSDISTEPFLCDSLETLFHPRRGTTWDNSTVLIVNTKEYKQGVRREVCRQEGEPCRDCGFETVCKQIYHYRTLVALDPINGKPYKEQILLPSCCKCAKRHQ